MAKCSINLPEDFLVKMSKLGEKTDEIVPKVLQAGGEVVADKVKSCLSAVIGAGTKYESRSTGELVDSVGVSPALQDRDGNFNVKIGFSDPRKDGSKNAVIASVIEYGKSGQPPRPFMKPAIRQSKNSAVKKMTAVFDEEVKKL